MRRVDPSVVSTNSVLTVWYIQFLDSLFMLLLRLIRSIYSYRAVTVLCLYTNVFSCNSCHIMQLSYIASYVHDIDVMLNS